MNPINRIGQKVVCIAEAEWEMPDGSLYRGHVPVLDQVYTVTGFGEPSVEDSYGGITVAELPVKSRAKGAREWKPFFWPIEIFRPRFERETDISAFLPAPTKQREDA